MLLGAYAHQDLPFEQLVGVLHPERDASRTPIFQVMFALQNAPLPIPAGGPLGLEVLDTTSGTAKFDLMLVASEEEGGLRLLMEYATDLFDASTIDRMLGHLRTLLESVVTGPDAAVGSLSMLTEEERRLLIGKSEGPAADLSGLTDEDLDAMLLDLTSSEEEARPLSDTASMTSPGPIQERTEAGRPARPAGIEPGTGCVHRLFAAQARRAPDRIALTVEGRSSTYGEIDARSDRLARALRALGVGPEVLVGLYVERSADLIVAILGVLKAGGAYVPLDPAYPAERLALILDDARTPILLTQRAQLDRLPEHSATVVCLDDDEAVDALPAADSPDGGARLNHLAYVIYTSGSTGRPKGVAVTHANVARLLAKTRPWFGFGPSDVWTLFHSFAFDFSVWEIWGAPHPRRSAGRRPLLGELLCPSRSSASSATRG